MKHRIIYLVLSLGLVTCISNKVTHVQYNPYKGGANYSFVVPSGYSEHRTSGDNEYLQEYLYTDSMVFYVTSFRNTRNYDEIRKQGTYYDRFEALNDNDSIILKGVSKDSLYWKDKLMKSGVTIGYSKVPWRRLEEFDAAILSLRGIE